MRQHNYFAQHKLTSRTEHKVA